MLSMIKSLIQEKTSFMEDANLILENTMPVLDDSIILGESYNDMDYDALIEAGEDTSVDSDDTGDVATEDDTSDAGDMEEEPHEEPDGDEVPGGEPDGDEDDIMGQKLDDDTDDATRQPEPIDTDVNNDILTQSIADELPEPIGAQTNEPINDNNDILSMTIDIGSNTPTDILPIPPANAADAVPDDSDDIMNQRVDSGFGTDGMPSDHSAEENGEGADISDDDTGDDTGDIGESSEDDINDETLDESVEVLEEKATQEHYAREAFKKKYNFKPLSGDPNVGTIEIDGKTVKIDMKKSKTMTVSGVSQVRQTAANLSDDDTIYLAPEFFKIKNPERRDAVLKHELGHLQMHKKTLEGAKIFDKRFVDKDVITSIILSALGVNKTDLENPIIASIVDASLDYEPISNLLNSKVNDDTFTTIRDGVKKVAEKYIGNNRNAHTNLAELEADRYAANRSSEKALKKGIRNYSRLIYKNSAELIKSLGITDPDLIKQYTKLMHINGADDILRRAKALKDPTLRNASIYKPESYDDPKIDALAKFLEKYDESNDIFNEDYFEEKSHRKLQFDYSVVKDTNSGHSVLLIFDLKGAQVTGTAGDIWDEIGKMMSNDKDSYDASIDARHNTANKNISKYGNLMHTAPGLKLLAIRDMNDNKKLQSVTFKNDEGDFTIKVGDKSPEWLMLTTKVLDVSENGTPLDIAKFMVGTVNRNLRRGHKIDDMELTDDGSNVRFKHPSKKDVKDNPDAYKKEYANDYYDDPFMEDISLGGDDAGSKDTATADVPEATASAGDLSDDVNASADTSSDDTSSNEEESPVTAAVKDKVAEADATDVVSTASTTSQQEIMNKLSNITKNLEDVKKSIMSSLQ